MVEETSGLSELVERVAAVDLGKTILMARVRVPHADKPGRRCQGTPGVPDVHGRALTLAGNLRGNGVTLEAQGSPAGCSMPGTRRTSRRTLIR